MWAVATVGQNQARQKKTHDYHAKARDFQLGSGVFVVLAPCGFHAGVVCEQRGPLSFVVKLEDEHIVRGHVDHIKSNFDSRL